MLLEKYFQKSIASFGKGSTFAPAVGGRGARKRGHGSKFFESLRPAQDRRRAMRRQWKEPFKGRPTTREHQGGTRDSE